jgi:glutamate/tyrosine decarboxylase-like PLP-dependent enzyme
MAAYQNGQMPLSLQLQPASIPVVALAVLRSAALAQWLALRPIGRSGIARIVRERST